MLRVQARILELTNLIFVMQWLSKAWPRKFSFDVRIGCLEKVQIEFVYQARAQLGIHLQMRSIKA